MTSINRRAFIATASAAVASSAALPLASNLPAASAAEQSPDPIVSLSEGAARHFLSKTKRGRFDLGTAAKKAAWFNIYPLAAVVVAVDKKSARIVFPITSNHELGVWYFDGNDIRHKTIEKSLTVKSGLTGTSLTLHCADNANLGHPYDDLSLLADNTKLALGASSVVNATGVLTIDVAFGHLFGGRPYQGGDLMFQTYTYKTLSDAENDVNGTAMGTTYSLTDNFNWLAERTANLELEIDGAAVTVPEPTGEHLTCVSLTHDSMDHSKEVLAHNRYFGRIVGLPEDTNLSLPRFAHGQAGEDTWEGTWRRNSDDPICNGRIIWAS